MTHCVTQNSQEQQKRYLELLFENITCLQVEIDTEKKKSSQGWLSYLKISIDRGVNMIYDHIKTQKGLDRLWNWNEIKTLECNRYNCKTYI